MSNLGSGPISFDGGTLQYAAGNTADISTRSVTIGAGGAGIDVGQNNVTFANPVGNGGPGGLTKLGAGGLTLAAPSSFGGDVQMTAGTLTLADPDALAANTLDYTGGTLAFAGLTAATLGALSGSQALALTNNSGQGVAVTVGGNNVATTFSGALSGEGSLIKTGDQTLTLTGPGSAAVTVVDPSNLVVPGGVVSLTAPVVMVGMPLTLSAAVADPFGQCQSVAFYLDPSGAADTLLGTATQQAGGVWSITVSTTGWSPSTATGFTPSTEDVTAIATFSPGTTRRAGVDDRRRQPERHRRRRVGDHRPQRHECRLPI